MYDDDWQSADDDRIFDEPTPTWTWRRALYLLIALLVIIALLAATFWPLLNPPQPITIPTTPPASL